VGSNADTIPNQEKKLLFHSDYVQLVGVSDMIQHSRRLAHWVTAEVISAANVKVLLFRFLANSGFQMAFPQYC